MKAVFMGTPDFAVGSLKALIENNIEVVGVFTQPDKPQGRKMVLTPPPVKVLAEENNIPVFQPKTLRDGQALSILSTLDYDIIIVVAYGKFLPVEILNSAKYGSINVHGSLLPKYRGASPIQWSIVCGEKKTGVTTMFMDEGMDTGDMLLTKETEITAEDTAETLSERLAEMGAELLIETVKKIEEGSITRTKQDNERATYAPIITKEMGKIDFTKSAEEINCLIRGLISWPTAHFYLENSRVKVFSSTITKGENKAPGTVLSSNGKLIVQCGNNTAIEFLLIQPEGKGKMTASAFLNGRKIEEGSNLCG